MRLYDSLEMFDIGLSHVRKWMRCGQAIRQSTHLPLDTAYSLGDSLTFWAVPAGALADDRYVGHRRYHTVLSPIDEPLAVYVRPKTALRPAGAYSDVSDREWFGLPNDDEEGVPCVVPVGGILIMEECEAMRINATPEAVGRVSVVRVTVEGFTFPNK